MSADQHFIESYTTTYIEDAVSLLTGEPFAYFGAISFTPPFLHLRSCHTESAADSPQHFSTIFIGANWADHDSHGPLPTPINLQQIEAGKFDSSTESIHTDLYNTESLQYCRKEPMTL